MKPNICYRKMAKQCTNELVTDCDVYIYIYLKINREAG